MRWRLLLEEYGPDIVNIKGYKNAVADTLSRLPKQGDIMGDVEVVLTFVPVDENIFPMQLKEIQSYQAKDRDLRRKIKNNPVHFQKETVEQVKIIRILNAMIFVDLGTGWIEISEIPDKTSARISQIFNNAWLSRYPTPRKVIFDNRNEFKKDFLPLLRDFCIKPTPTTIKNLLANSILERIHQGLGNILRTKDLKIMNLMT